MEIDTHKKQTFFLARRHKQACPCMYRAYTKYCGVWRRVNSRPDII